MNALTTASPTMRLEVQAPQTSIGLSPDGKWYWDGLKHRNVSADGRYWWDGAQWQELKR